VIAGCIARVCEALKAQPAESRVLPKEEIAAISKEVKELCAKHPIYRA